MCRGHLITQIIKEACASEALNKPNCKSATLKCLRVEINIGLSCSPLAILLSKSRGVESKVFGKFDESTLLGTTWLHLYFLLSCFDSVLQKIKRQTMITKAKLNIRTHKRKMFLQHARGREDLMTNITSQHYNIPVVCTYGKSHIFYVPNK